jgi:hypothetical protein
MAWTEYDAGKDSLSALRVTAPKTVAHWSSKHIAKQKVKKMLQKSAHPLLHDSVIVF